MYIAMALNDVSIIKVGEAQLTVHTWFKLKPDDIVSATLNIKFIFSDTIVIDKYSANYLGVRANI